MSHTTTLVVDFDDTIALTLNRDWVNAAPNIALIEKLNSLFDRGWTIHIVTARGQLSCNGDHNAAEQKYGVQIKEWLAKHQVKYTDLSFQKKLAVYYVDDKGIHPDDFIKKFKQTPLQGGLSGATIVRDHMNNTVIKTATNTASVVEWFKHAEKNGLAQVPKIHTVIGQSITMEYVEHWPMFFKDSVVQSILYRFSKNKPMHENTYETRHKYVHRCLSRIKDILTSEQFHLIDSMLSEVVHETEISFSHGDFSKSNILVNSVGEHILIDPINDPELLSSWEIDLAKYNLTSGSSLSSTTYKDIVHQIGHLCRMLPYSLKNNQTAFELQKQQLQERLQYVL